MVWLHFLSGNVCLRSVHVYCALFELLSVLTAGVEFALAVCCAYSFLFSICVSFIFILAAACNGAIFRHGFVWGRWQ